MKTKFVRKNHFVLLVVLIVMCTSLFTACSFGFDIALRAPVVFDDSVNKTINWQANSKAVSYEIYVNNSRVSTIVENGDVDTHYYDYSEHVLSDGLYTIKVRAMGGEKYENSKFSNVITVIIGENTVGNYDTSEIQIVRDSQYAPSQIDINETTQNIWWNVTTKNGANPTQYVVQIYCNNYTDSDDNADKIRSFYVTQQYFKVTDYLKGNEVLAITISSVYDGDDNLYVSDIYYYNPLDNGEYSQVYTFDGGVYDYYIEDYEELQNIYYYVYIYRLTTIKFMVAPEFYWANTDTYFNTSTYYSGSSRYFYYQKYIVGTSSGVLDTWAYYETFNFSAIPQLEISTIGTSGPATVVLKEGFGTADEPTLTATETGYVGLSVPALEKHSLETPYYETVQYQDRDADYDNFASDKCVLTTYCDTSEKLYWAVENNVTPLFSDNTSRAYVIYNKAKEVLREIIKDDMTDYEKVLSIFDWVSNNTRYDHNAANNGASTDNCCYYLEGVFMNENCLAVCDGLSKAYSLLCNMEGIDCYRIVGSVGDYGHAWNKVKLQNKWYVVDITWTKLTQYEVAVDEDDNVLYDVDTYYGRYYCAPVLEYDYEFISHKYFLVDDDYISSTHTPFANRTKLTNTSIPSNNMYGFYTKTSYGGYSRVVDDIDDLKNIMDYVYTHNCVGTFELVIDWDWYCSQNYSGLSAMLQQARGDNTFIGIVNEGWIISLSSTLSTIDATSVVDNDTGKTYTCTYQRSAVQSFVPVVYDDLGNEGVFLYIACNTNIIQVDSENIDDSSNRYNSFVNYARTLVDDFESSFTVQDEFIDLVLQDVGSSLDTDQTDDQINEIIDALTAKLYEDINKDLVGYEYIITLTYDSKGQDTSNNGSTFEEKTYNYHKFNIKIEKVGKLIIG